MRLHPLALAAFLALSHGAARAETDAAPGAVPAFGETVTTSPETAMMTTQQRDRAAIVEAVENIARGADLHQWNAVRSSFAPSVVLDYGTPETLTPQAIAARWQPLLEAFDATQHQVSEIVVDVRGDRAEVRSRFRATHWLRGAPGGEVWTLAGRYEHALTRTADGWRVTRMRMLPGESTGNPALLDAAKARAAAAPMSGRTVVEAFFSRLEAFDIAGFAALFAEDGRQVMPFAPEGFPKLLDGRAAVFNQYRGMPDNFRTMRFPDLVIREGDAPGTYFATWRGEIELIGGGRYDNSYAGLFRIEDGRIVEFVEYFDPIVLQRAFGTRLQEEFNVR